LSEPRYRSERLTTIHDLSAFCCGNDILDAWLREHAVTSQAKRTSVSYVWTADKTNVVAYYSLAPHLIERAALPRHVSRGDPQQIPAILLARLALDQKLRGMGLGSILLLDALSRAAAASHQVGGRYVVVDAIDERAESYYQHHGFILTPAPRRLVRKVSDIEADIKVL
jgi:GNAT superfamily N-acetyltransferase